MTNVPIVTKIHAMYKVETWLEYFYCQLVDNCPIHMLGAEFTSKAKAVDDAVGDYDSERVRSVWARVKREVLAATAVM